MESESLEFIGLEIPRDYLLLGRAKMNRSETSITFSGKILTELSEKIPSNIIAINELIKNAYDAGANTVEISFYKVSKKLIIKDDGDGMDKEDIDTLFHIAESSKKYGSINKYNRITQGSKGLGFLSVFKFGNKVSWETNKSVGYRFSLEYDKLVNTYDISNRKIIIEEDSTIEKGTKIEIDLDVYNAKSLSDYFKDLKNYQKIVNAINDDEFSIILSIKEDYCNIEPFVNFKLEEINKIRQLYNVKYNSVENKIQFFVNGHLAFEEDFFTMNKRYRLDLNLVIFKFPQGKSLVGKNCINQLFYNQRNELTPLVYVNNNLFNNYEIFDPRLLSTIKIGDMLNQMIGFINIYSDDQMIEFNSDRTKFLQNELTDEIIDKLKELNQRIQKSGSLRRKYLVDFDILRCTEIQPKDAIEDKYLDYVKEDFSFTRQLQINRKESYIEYNLFGKVAKLYIVDNNNDSHNTNNQGNDEKSKTSNTTYKKTIAAKISLRSNIKSIPIPSSGEE